MATSRVIEPVQSSAKTASSASAVFDVSDVDQLILTLNVTAASGTSPTLDVKVQHSVDAGTWTDLVTFTQKIASGTEDKAVTTPFHGKIKVVYTVGGTTPSFTFGVKATVKNTAGV
jgi:hypothetical protein